MAKQQHVPLFRASLAVSLDGYIADRAGGVDWLNPYFCPEIDFGAFMNTIGATVMGRTTFDQALARKDGSAGGPGTYVLTRRPIANAPAGVAAFDGDVRELASQVRQRLAGTGKDIWLMGGGVSIGAFRAAGLVDRWEVSVIPILLGEGIPLFPGRSGGTDELQLTHSRVLSNGIIEAWYEPARGPAATRGTNER